MNNNESRVIVVTGAAKLDGIGAKPARFLRRKSRIAKLLCLTFWRTEHASGFLS